MPRRNKKANKGEELIGGATSWARSLTSTQQLTIDTFVNRVELEKFESEAAGS